MENKNSKINELYQNSLKITKHYSENEEPLCYCSISDFINIISKNQKCNLNIIIICFNAWRKNKYGYENSNSCNEDEIIIKYAHSDFPGETYHLLWFCFTMYILYKYITIEGNWVKIRN